MTNHVVGLFDESEVADRAVKDLIAAGFDHRKISILTADPHGKLYRHYAEEPAGTMAGEGAAVGVTSGAIIGGIIGLLIGVGLFFVPIGLVAAGPIAGLLAGGTLGAATGGVLGGLIGVGISEKDADIYAECIRRGGTLLTVEAAELDTLRAHEILNRDGAVDINDRALRYREEGFLRYDPNAPSYTPEQADQERRRIAKEAGEIDEAQAYLEQTYGPGSGTASGVFREKSDEDSN
jgi:hypothetical protein